MVVLVITQNGTAHRYPLSEGRTILGRAQHCDVVINDDSISRQHAEIVVRTDQVQVSDLDSRNGTYRGSELLRQASVSFGDRLLFGDVEAVLERTLADNRASPQDLLPDPSLTIVRRIDDLPGSDSQHEAIDAPRLIRLLGEIALYSGHDTPVSRDPQPCSRSRDERQRIVAAAPHPLRDQQRHRDRRRTVLGDVVNTAARLETVAEPDQIVISRATYERIQPSINARSLGEVPLRGRAGKVEILSVDL